MFIHIKLSGGGNFLAVLILSFSFLSIVPQMVLFIKNDKIRDVIGYVGRNTLPIYLFHPIFTMAAKYALKFFYFDSTGYLHLLFTICISIIGSLAIAYILDKWKLSYIFARKKFLRWESIRVDLYHFGDISSKSTKFYTILGIISGNSYNFTIERV